MTSTRTPQPDGSEPGTSATGKRSRPDTMSCPASSFSTAMSPAVAGGGPAGSRSLDEATIALLSAGVPTNTRRAYAAGRRAWAAWCGTVGLPSLPPSASDLARYATFLLTVGSPVVATPRPLSSATVEAHLSAISTWAVEQGHLRPDLRGARLVLRGHQRGGDERGRGRAAPITVDILRTLVAQAMLSRRADGTPTMRALRDRTALTLGFALGARRSELVAVDLQHIVRVPQGLAVDVWRVKTRTSSDAVAVPHGVDPELCPVRTTLTWLAALQEHGCTQGPRCYREAPPASLAHNGHCSSTRAGRGTPTSPLPSV